MEDWVGWCALVIVILGIVARIIPPFVGGKKKDK